MSEQLYYGHGKLLLTGEYFVLDGAKSVALPTKLGQKMFVKGRPSNHPKLYWKSYDHTEKCWLEVEFELWHFDILSPKKPTEKVLTLQHILRQARKQNIHFLRDEVDFYVETKIEFPLNWGLGSSSTLIYNIAQWAYISPFELLSNTFKGSGYDIACAQSMGPITYQIKSRGPHWETTTFSPPFKNQLYFLYLNKKKNSHDDVVAYHEKNISNKPAIVQRISEISEAILSCKDLEEFECLILEHENLISTSLGKERLLDSCFSDYSGVVKSLGAWGGDFALVTSSQTYEETQQYFKQRGYDTFIKFDELILQSFEKYKKPFMLDLPVEENRYVCH